MHLRRAEDKTPVLGDSGYGRFEETNRHIHGSRAREFLNLSAPCRKTAEFSSKPIYTGPVMRKKLSLFLFLHIWGGCSCSKLVWLGTLQLFWVFFVSAGNCLLNKLNFHFWMPVKVMFACVLDKSTDHQACSSEETQYSPTPDSSSTAEKSHLW